MKLWHAIIIATFMLVYGTLSLLLLGSWIVESVRPNIRIGGRRACGADDIGM